MGNLNNGANAGLFYVNGNNALSNTRWNIGSRVWLHLLIYAPEVYRGPQGHTACHVN